VSTIDTSQSGNGRGSDAWLRSWTHLGIDRRSTGYCRVTFDHPPINAITATTVAELAEVVELIREDADLNVVVFDSANSGFYLTDDDTENDPSATAARAWHDLLVRLSRAPVVSIASIRGHVRGAGSEFVLACDLRFASLENTVLGQFEIGAGPVPRGHALELHFVADDQLDDEVDQIASRLVHFDHDAIARTKSAVG
jgi:enoyl-CoA hydratase/carnithine racemase